ncbi:MAG TPA: hypothetical protein VGK73_39040 [Polyangiaceae bacterium]
MLKPLLFVGTLLSGGGLFAYTLTMQRARLEPSLEPSPEVVQVVPPPARISEPEPAVVEPAVVDIEPVTIYAPLRRAARPAAVEPPVEATPCSDWRELGPQQLKSGTTTVMHQVRSLCQ